jgi:hypothetical protein
VRAQRDPSEVLPVRSHPARPLLAVALALVCLAGSAFSAAAGRPRASAGVPGRAPLVFAVFAEDREQLGHALILTESVRTYAGSHHDAPVWVYVPRGLAESEPALAGRLAARKAELRASEAPEDALAFPLSRKVFAAAQAESAAVGRGEVLVWMDEDTIVLREPREFRLAKGVSLAYRPVMHNRTGSLYDRPADVFWARVYQTLSVPESAIFPMVTPADSQTIRAYFNAGLLVVRPERGILRQWAVGFPLLYGDTAIVRMCRQDRVKALFLHQTALVGAVLNRVKRTEMRELPRGYNFPLFFKAMYGARREFDSIAGVVTLRYDAYFQNPAPDWGRKLKGPPETIAWLTERLDRK